MGKLHPKWWLPLTIIIAPMLFFSGCVISEEDFVTDHPPPSTKIANSSPTLDMGFPISLTGAESTTTALTSPVALRIAGGTDTRSIHGEPHCFFDGAGNDDPFDNGYLMTRFLVSTVAAWMCLTDFIINEVASFNFPTDGSIFEIEADPNDPGAPTGISITLDSETQRTIRLYMNGDTTTPGLYVSWNTNGGSTEGKLILTSGFVNDADSPDPNSPDGMRLDFEITSDTQTADMFISFPSTHTFINGFRIQVTKDLDSTAYPIFTALGRMDLSAQFDPNYVAGVSGSTLPSLLMYTISDANGNGAAIASFSNVGISFDLTDCCLLAHLGHYMFTKEDKYFFDSALAPVWINKNVTEAIFQDATARTTDSANLNNIELFLDLGGTYFDTECAVGGDDCQAFLDAVFANGDDFGAEANFGSDPDDDRSDIINNVGASDYLQSICPDDAADCTFDDTDVFEQSFTPTN